MGIDVYQCYTRPTAAICAYIRKYITVLGITIESHALILSLLFKKSSIKFLRFKSKLTNKLCGIRTTL